MILSVLGPIRPPDPTRCGTSCVSIHDRLISNRTAFVGKELNTGKINLDNLSSVHRNPDGFLSNVVLDFETTDTELRRFANDRKEETSHAISNGNDDNALFNIICDSTPNSHGKSEAALFQLAEQLTADTMHIVVGTGWSRSSSNSENVLAESLATDLIRDLTIGFRLAPGTGKTSAPLSSDATSAIGRAGFIGELCIESFPLDETDIAVLQAAAVAHDKSRGAPIMIAVPHCAETAIHIGEAVVQSLVKFGVEPKSICLTNIVTCCHGGNPAQFETMLSQIQTKLLSKGVYISLDCGSCGIPFPKESERSSMPISIDQLVYAIDTLKRNGFLSQLVVSNDVKYKHQLNQFGGSGYEMVMTNVRWRLYGRGYPKSEVIALVSGNAIAWLSWYSPPAAPPPKAMTYWYCVECNKKVKSTKDPFIWQDFRYCSMKCLRAHREKQESDSNKDNNNGNQGGGRGRAGNRNTGWGISVGT